MEKFLIIKHMAAGKSIGLFEEIEYVNEIILMKAIKNKFNAQNQFQARC